MTQFFRKSFEKDIFSGAGTAFVFKVMIFILSFHGRIGGRRICSPAASLQVIWRSAVLLKHRVDVVNVSLRIVSFHFRTVVRPRAVIINIRRSRDEIRHSL